ncbi:hypothetical protein Tco_0038168 [Tanacetum coccineum]
MTGLHPIHDYAKTIALWDIHLESRSVEMSLNTRLKLIELPQMNIAPRRLVLTIGNVGNAKNVGNTRNAGNSGNNAGARNVRNYGKGIKTIGPRCYNCRGTRHFARDYKAKLRKKYPNYFKEQMLFAKQEESNILLNEEEYNFLGGAAKAE